MKERDHLEELAIVGGDSRKVDLEEIDWEGFMEQFEAAVNTVMNLRFP
jgi:hypothetical protein